MSGNNVIGNVYNESRPSNVSMMETTVDKTGRSINLLNMIIVYDALNSADEMIYG